MTDDPRLDQAADLRKRGDFAGSERLLRAALAEGHASARLHCDLAATVSRLGREAEMEQGLRDALALDPAFAAAAEPLSRYLLVTNRPADALEVTTAAVGASDTTPLLINHIDALRALARPNEALAPMRALAARLPTDGMVQQQLASVLVECGLFDEAQAVLDALRAGGFDHPVAWLMRGYADQGRDRLADAETAYREAIRRAPGFPDPHRELAQLVWMRTGDVAQATAELDRVLAAEPRAGALRQVKARLLQYAVDEKSAFAALEPALGGANADPALLATGSQLAVGFDPAMALHLARRALVALPNDANTVAITAAACLADGRPDEGLTLAERLRILEPLNQHAVALIATAWRLLGDPRYGELYDYERLVRPARFDIPEGWSSLDAFLADLARSLHALHVVDAHPVGQSLRGGSQSHQRLDLSPDPVIQAYFQAIDGPIRRYIEALGTGPDPLRERSTGGYRVSGSWSVRLRPGGRHVSHLHPQGWLSSASYIELPDAVDAGGREGWIGFGEPGIPTRPTLEAEHWVKPEPGLLVLFPSYMWHGTAPFGGDQTRLTAAFDVVPA